MDCKFQNKFCRENLQKRRVQDWNSTHPIEFQINDNSLDPLSDSSYIRFGILFDDSLHICKKIIDNQKDI